MRNSASSSSVLTLVLTGTSGVGSVAVDTLGEDEAGSFVTARGRGRGRGRGAGRVDIAVAN